MGQNEDLMSSQNDICNMPSVTFSQCFPLIIPNDWLDIKQFRPTFYPIYSGIAKQNLHVQK